MSLGGLVAYGDSDDSDLNEEESDHEEKQEVAPGTERKGTAAEEGPKPEGDPGPASVDVGEGQTDISRDGGSTSEGGKVYPNIGTVDDIEDDEYELQTHGKINASSSAHQQQNVQPVTLATSFGLKLPPPKHVDGTGGENIGPSLVTSNNRPQNAPISEKSILDDSETSEISLAESKPILAGLPAPKATKSTANDLGIEEDEIEEEIKEKATKLAALAKPPPKPAKRQPVKISVPSLDDYGSDEEDRPAKKKPKISSAQGKSGLFALLPEPKNISVKTTNRPLIPYTLTKKAPPTTSKTKPSPRLQKKSATAQSVLPGIPTEASDDEDEEEGGAVNFFSLGGPSSLRVNTAPDVNESEKVQPILLGPWQQKMGLTGDPTLNPVNSKGLTGTTSAVHEPSSSGDTNVTSSLDDIPLQFKGPSPGPSYTRQPVENYTEQYGESSDNQQPEYQYEEQQHAEVERYLQDEEFLKLAGKRQRGKEKIDFIDLQAQDHTSNDQLTKNLTEEVSGFSHSRKKDDLPSSQSRRKHQITYLAYQAKERELELKNQWAQNRQTKKQTQSKYGF